MKKKSKDIKSFVENIRLKSTYCKINISQIEEFMMEVGIHFIGEKSMENREFLKAYRKAWRSKKKESWKGTRHVRNKDVRFTI